MITELEYDAQIQEMIGYEMARFAHMEGGMVIMQFLGPPDADEAQKFYESLTVTLIHSISGRLSEDLKISRREARKILERAIRLGTYLDAPPS